MTIRAAAWLKSSLGAAAASSLAFFAAALRAALAPTCWALRFAPSLRILWVESFIVGLRGFMPTSFPQAVFHYQLRWSKNDQYIKANRIERSVTIGSEALDAEIDALE
jgi:hypothetical protein